jgi:hypothetical protein
MITLEVQDWNSQAIEATLDDILFYIVLDWNDSGQYWTMAIRNSAYSSIVDGISLVPNYPLTYQFRYAEMPPGELWALCANDVSGPIPRDGFTSGVFQLCYQFEQEIIDAGMIETYGRTAPSVV